MRGIVFVGKAFASLESERESQSCQTLCDPLNIQSMEFSRPEYWSG